MGSSEGAADGTRRGSRVFELKGSNSVSDAAVHMAIRRLRQKLKLESSDSDTDGLIRSHRGIGYSINSD